MDYQNNNNNGSTNGFIVAKKRHSPTELKASKGDSVGRFRSEENNTTLPEPTFRQVPVNVARRTDSPVVPIPPPRNTKDSEAKPKRRVSNREGKRRIDGDGGSDSDSDRDERKKAAEEVSPVIKSSKNPHEAGTEVEFSSHEPTLDIKLAWQMEFRISARQIQDKNEIKWRLIDFRQNNYERPPLNDTLIRCQEKLLEYLNTTKGSRASAMPRSLEGILGDMIYHAEKVLLKQCSRFDDLESSGKSQDLRLLDVLGRVLRALSKFYPFVTRYEAYKSTISEQKLSSTGPHVGTNGIRSSDYWADVLRRFRAAYRFGSHIELARPIGITDVVIHAMIERLWDKVIFAMCDAAMSMPMHEAIDKTLLEIIGQSRQDTQLAPSYIQWIASGNDVKLLDELYWNTAGRTVADGARAVMGGSVSTSEAPVSHEFCSELTGPTNLSLVLLNLDGGIQRIKEVSEDESADFGWIKEVACAAPWRCEPVGDGRDILKVSVNGIILGVFGLKRGTSGARPLDWVFVPVRALKNNPLEACSSLGRQINKSEERALGLAMVSE